MSFKKAVYSNGYIRGYPEIRVSFARAFLTVTTSKMTRLKVTQSQTSPVISLWRPQAD